MPTTPKLGIPYPVLADPADVPQDTGELATQIDSLAAVANGLATLDAAGKLPIAQLPVAAVIASRGARAEQNNVQAIPNAAWTALTFDEENRDDGGMFAPASPTRITINAAGWYVVSGGVELAANATGIARYLMLSLNGPPSTGRRLAVQSGLVSATANARIMLATALYLVPGDYVEAYAYQDSGGNLNTGPNPLYDDTHLAVCACVARNVACVLSQTGAGVSCPTGTATAVPFDTEVTDPDDLHAAGTPSRITAKVAGVYTMTGQIVFAAHATGRRALQIRLNGATIIGNVQEPAVADAGAGNALAVEAQYPLAVNDYIELLATQYSGTSLLANAGRFAATLAV